MNTDIDVKDILKDVEVCLKQGLQNKLNSFFDDYDMFQRTHNEVLNLSIVKKILQTNTSECERIFHDSIASRYETEIEALRNENKNLSIELERYRKYLDFYIREEEEEGYDEREGDHEIPLQSINLEITEKHSEVKDTDTDNNSILQIQIEKNIKNIVLNSVSKDIVEEEEEEEEAEDDTEEEDDTDTEEETEEDTEEDTEEEEEEEVVAKEECVPTAIEIHCCSSDSEEEENLIKSLDNSEEEEEEEVMPTFPTAQELTKLKEINNVASVEEENADANSVESENDVQAETEEAEAEEEEELNEVQINGVMYVSNDDEDGTIYSYVDEEVGDEIGKFIGKIAHIYKGANKGVYDITKIVFE